MPWRRNILTPDGDVDASVEIVSPDGMPIWKWTPSRLRSGEIVPAMTVQEIRNLLHNAVHSAVMQQLASPGDKLIIRIGNLVETEEFRIHAGALIWWEPSHRDLDEMLKFFRPADDSEQAQDEAPSYPPAIEQWELDFPQPSVEDFEQDEDPYNLFGGSWQDNAEDEDDDDEDMELGGWAVVDMGGDLIQDGFETEDIARQWIADNEDMLDGDPEHYDVVWVEP